MRRLDGARHQAEAPAAGGEEERALGAAREQWARVAQAPCNPQRRLLAERDDPILAALAPHVHVLLLEVDVAEVESDRLRAAEARRVDELEQRAVPKRDRLLVVEALDELLDLLELRRIRQAARLPRRQRELGHAGAAERVPDQRADRRDPAGDRSRGETLPPQIGHVFREDPRVDLLELQSAPVEPARERVQIGAVRAPGRIGERRRGEEAIDRVHAARFLGG